MVKKEQLKTLEQNKSENIYVLKVENLSVEFITFDGIVKAVRGVSFDVENGEVLGIVGESGSGKSVTVRSILRLIAPPGRITGGKIFLNGVNLLSLTEQEMTRIRGRYISMIFQEPSAALNPVLTVGDQIAEVLTVHHGLSRKAAWKQAIKHLHEVGIPAPEHRIRDYPHQMSGGMQQRCMIAIALACKPKFLIADEPTTSLDVTVQAQILNLLVNLVRKNNVGLIFITHDIAVIAQIADHILVMYSGKVMESGPADRIINSPKHPYTIELLRAMPTLRAKRRQRLAEIKGEVPNPVSPPPGCPFHPRCPRTMDECSESEPGLDEVEPGHRVACWLYQ